MQRRIGIRHRAAALLLCGLSVGIVVIALRWDRAAPLARTSPFGGVASAAAVDERHGVVYVTGQGESGLGRVWEYDSASGHLRRVVTVGGIPAGIAVDERRGLAFVVDSASMRVTVLSTRTGAIARRVVTGPWIGTGLTATRALAISPRWDRVFVGAAGDGANGAQIPSRIALLDARDGRLLRTINAPADLAALVADDRDGRLFAFYQDSPTVTMLDARTGATLRTVMLDQTPVALAVDEQRHRVYVAGSPFAPTPGEVTVLDARSGATVRAIALSYVPTSLAVDAPRCRVFVLGAEQDTMTMLDGCHGGAIIRATRAGRLPVAIVLANQGRRALILDNNSPGLMGGPPTLVVMIGQHGASPLMRDMSVDGPGTVGVLDARSGRLLRTVPVGLRPTRLVVDDAAQRAFVVNDGGIVATRDTDPWGWLPAVLRRWLPFYRAPGTHLTHVPSSVMVIDTRNL